MIVNLTNISPRFYGMWIALDDKKTLLGSGKTADQAWKRATNKRGNRSTLIVTRVARPEIPNDDLLEAMRIAEEEEKSGALKFYTTVEDFIASLD